MTERLGTGTTSTPAVKGLNTGTDPDQGRGVWGESDEHDGVAGYSSSAGRFAGYFKNLSDGEGLYAETSGYARASLWGYAGGDSSYGVYGQAFDNSGYGVYATSTESYALYVDGVTRVEGTLFVQPSHSGLGAAFTGGSVTIYGDLTALGTNKSFVMDHPLDPANRLLKHSCVEGPEQRNIYQGTATADDKGTITVHLANYIETLNTDYCYQLTALGEAAPDLHVRNEVAGTQFTIAGAKPFQQISWQLTGKRNDPASRQRPYIPEADKRADHKGRYFCPEAFGQPSSAGIRHRQTPPRSPALPKDPR